jgi:predicted amidophosphoribosyltransferase
MRQRGFCFMEVETFECEDNYEAEKLAGLLAIQKDRSPYVSRIAGTFRNEIIIILKDKSSHSVTLVDDVVTGTRTIIECRYQNQSSQLTISTLEN